MLKLSKRADYGLIALKHLAVQGREHSASAKEIGGHYKIPVPLMSKVLQTLTRHGFLSSEHGTRGGYRLARDPRSISALEVVKAIDGPVILTSCFTDHRDCDQSERCIVREPLRKIHEGILGLLASIKIADMTAGEEETPGGGHGWEEPDSRLYSVESGIAALSK